MTHYCSLPFLSWRSRRTRKSQQTLTQGRYRHELGLAAVIRSSVGSGSSGEDKYVAAAGIEWSLWGMLIS